MTKQHKSKSNSSSSSSEVNSHSYRSSSSSSSSSSKSNVYQNNKNKIKKRIKIIENIQEKKGCNNVRIITPEEIVNKNKEESRFINPYMINCQDLRELIESKEDIKKNREEIEKNEKIWNSLFIKNFGSNRTFENKLTNSVTTHKKRILRYLENKKKTTFRKGDKSVAYPIQRKKKKTNKE